MRTRAVAAVSLALLSFAGTSIAEDKQALYEHLGTYHRDIRTESEKAQAYFDQGMMLRYAFGRGEAVKSFHACLHEDPKAAMCAWGAAWATGPFQNGDLKYDAAVNAYKAAQRALQRVDKVSPVEKALIEAQAVRYVEDPNSADRKELDMKYAEAMRSVAERFPDDHDVQTLLADALITLHPWDQYPEGKARPTVVEAIQVLEGVLARELTHTGACHLYIHAVEPSDDPGRGEACADVLTGQIPRASHIQHMPSHIYMRVGRYGDAVRANQKAYMVDQMAWKGEAASIYFLHNVKMMWFAGWMDGQSFLTIEAARYAAGKDPKATLELPLALTRFGRWDEILETRKYDKKGITGVIWHLARGLAKLRKDDETGAAKELGRMEKLIKRIDPADKVHFGHKQVDYAAVARGILAGEIAAARKDPDLARKELQAAIETEDQIGYSEPELWALPARQYLGAILLESGAPAEAQKVYEAELEDHPENGWSLFGLAASLRAQGKEDEAAAVDGRFEKAWARADVVLYASRF